MTEARGGFWENEYISLGSGGGGREKNLNPVFPSTFILSEPDRNRSVFRNFQSRQIMFVEDSEQTGLG